MDKELEIFGQYVIDKDLLVFTLPYLEQSVQTRFISVADKYVNYSYIINTHVYVTKQSLQSLSLNAFITLFLCPSHCR
jgi:hypothetical protein